MDESTLLLLGGLGVLAWLLAGGWPYVRDRHVADDGPVGLGAGITAVCPGCVAGGAADLDPAVATRLAASRPVPAASDAGLGHASTSLRPVGVGRDQSLRVGCPACGSVYAVLGVPSVVVPAPRGAAD